MAAIARTGVDLTSLATALRANGVAIPVGTLTEGETTLPVQVGAPLTTIEELRDLYLPVAGGAPVRLGDVASVESQKTHRALPSRSSTLKPQSRATSAIGDVAGGCTGVSPERGPDGTGVGASWCASAGAVTTIAPVRATRVESTTKARIRRRMAWTGMSLCTT